MGKACDEHRIMICFFECLPLNHPVKGEKYVKIVEKWNQEGFNKCLYFGLISH